MPSIFRISESGARVDVSDEILESDSFVTGLLAGDGSGKVTVKMIDGTVLSYAFTYDIDVLVFALGIPELLEQD
jgi:hypothetical protein